MDAAYYPVFLHLGDRLCVVIGSGRFAEEKVHGLLASGARIRLVTPEPTPELDELATSGRLELVRRDYRTGDLEGAFLGLSVLNDETINAAAWAEAEERNLPMNVMDDVPRCSFIAPSLVRRGHLQVAISTSGKAPALAVRMRQKLERELGEHHARFLELAAASRAPLLARTPSFQERKERWYRLVDSDVLDLIRQGDEEGAQRRFLEHLGVAPPLHEARDEDQDDASAAARKSA